MDQDKQYLKMLSIFHYVVGGFIACWAFIPFMFNFHILRTIDAGGDVHGFTRLMIVVIPFVFITLGLTMAFCLITAGRSLAKRKRYIFCLIILCQVYYLEPKVLTRSN